MTARVMQHANNMLTTASQDNWAQGIYNFVGLNWFDFPIDSAYLPNSILDEKKVKILFLELLRLVPFGCSVGISTLFLFPCFYTRFSWLFESWLIFLAHNESAQKYSQLTQEWDSVYTKSTWCHRSSSVLYIHSSNSRDTMYPIVVCDKWFFDTTEKLHLS
jgi:hypothetical protein